MAKARSRARQRQRIDECHGNSRLGCPRLSPLPRCLGAFITAPDSGQRHRLGKGGTTGSGGMAGGQDANRVVELGGGARWTRMEREDCLDIIAAAGLLRDGPPEDRWPWLNSGRLQGFYFSSRR